MLRLELRSPMIVTSLTHSSALRVVGKSHHEKFNDRFPESLVEDEVRHSQKRLVVSSCPRWPGSHDFHSLGSLDLLGVFLHPTISL